MTLLKVPYNENKSNDKGYYLNNQNNGKIRIFLFFLIEYIGIHF
jgi:hypothetical protein